MWAVVCSIFSPSDEVSNGERSGDYLFCFWDMIRGIGNMIQYLCSDAEASDRFSPRARASESLKGKKENEMFAVAVYRSMAHA